MTQSVRALLIQAMIGKQPDDYLFRESTEIQSPISVGAGQRHARLQAFQRCYFTSASYCCSEHGAGWSSGTSGDANQRAQKAVDL